MTCLTHFNSRHVDSEVVLNFVPLEWLIFWTVRRIVFAIDIFIHHVTICEAIGNCGW
jgi:hypothetical protein